MNGKENSTIKTKEDILNFIEEYKKNNEGVEPKEYIVQVNKSISLHDFGYFTIDINDAENCSKILNEQISKKINDTIDSIRTTSVGYKKLQLPISELLDESRFDGKLDSYLSMAVPNWNIQLYISVDSYEKFLGKALIFLSFGFIQQKFNLLILKFSLPNIF